MGDYDLMLKLLLHYQGPIRVPFIWHEPTRPACAVLKSYLGSSIDIYATIIGRADIQPYNSLQEHDLMGTASPKAILVGEDSQRIMPGFDCPQRIRTLVTDRCRMSLMQGED